MLQKRKVVLQLPCFENDIVLSARAAGELKSLPWYIQDIFWKQIIRLVDKPGHPSLKAKLLTGLPRNMRWFRINQGYRAIAELRQDKVWEVVAVGTHKTVAHTAIVLGAGKISCGRGKGTPGRW